MRLAIYYPHTHLQSETLLKSSLLLWDRLEFLAPEPYFNPQYGPEFKEAIELFGHYRHPTEQEKREVHALVEDFATGPLPEALFYRPQQQQHHAEYGIYAQKFLPETWQMLHDLQLSKLPAGNSRHRLVEATGLTMVSLLAECCAGTTRARITDRSDAYANIVNLAAQRTPPPGQNHDVAVFLTLGLVDAATVPLKALIEFRRKEAKSHGYDRRDLRHRYALQIEAYVDRVRTEGKKASDREEIQRQFEQDMKDDLAVFRDEFGAAKTMALTSEAVVPVVVNGVAAMSEWLTLGFPFVLTAQAVKETATRLGGIFRTHSELAAKRKEIMRKHPMAYMHQLGEFAPYHG